MRVSSRYVLLYLLPNQTVIVDSFNFSRVRWRSFSKKAIREILVLAAFPDDKVRERVKRSDGDLSEYAKEVIDIFDKSLSGYQFYDFAKFSFCLRFDEKERRVKVEYLCNIRIKRFGDEPFKISFRSSEKIDISSLVLRMKSGDLCIKKDYRLSYSDDAGKVKQEIKFLNECWMASDTLDFIYSGTFYEHDHWAQLVWLLSHPTKLLHMNCRCYDGLTIRECFDLSENKVRTTLSGDAVEMTSEGWLMPGNGFVLLVGNQKLVDSCKTSGKKT